MDGTDASARLVALAERFSDLQRRMAGEPDDVPRAVVDVASDAIRGAEWVSLTGRRPDGGFVTLAASDSRAELADKIQYDLDSGPCVDATADNAIYQPDDVRHDPRWPEFGRRVSEELGVRSMLAFRLALDGSELAGALNLYSREVGAFDDDAVAIGLLVATHAAAVAQLRRAEETSANLEVALQSSRDIGVAMGILMATHKLTRDQAFDLLRVASQHTNRKLRDLANEVEFTGTLDLPPRRPRRS